MSFGPVTVSDAEFLPLFPEIEPYTSHFVDVGDGQRIYVEEIGNPDGKPAVFVHGGPGGGVSAETRRFFDPEKYRIIQFDQRGCGRSTPHITDGADLSVNTTDHLISDIEIIRRFCGVGRWLVFGGSWGSTLSLAYAQRFPRHVTELVLRGIFLLRRSEIDWFYNPGRRDSGEWNGGAHSIFPDLWEHYLAPIPQDRLGDDLVAVYRDLLSDPDPRVSVEAARSWSTWEATTSYLLPQSEVAGWATDDHDSVAFARIENHYFSHGAFLSDGQLLENIDRIRHIPAVIVQGRYDVVCPTRSAWDLHRAWPEADFHLINAAGHASFEAGITDKLIRATNRFSA